MPTIYNVPLVQILFYNYEFTQWTLKDEYHFPRSPASKAFIEVFILCKSKIYFGKIHIHHVARVNRGLYEVWFTPSGQYQQFVLKHT